MKDHMYGRLWAYNLFCSEMPRAKMYGLSWMLVDRALQIQPRYRTNRTVDHMSAVNVLDSRVIVWALSMSFGLSRNIGRSSCRMVISANYSGSQNLLELLSMEVEAIAAWVV